MSKLDAEQIRRITEIVNDGKPSSKDVSAALSKLVENFRVAISQIREEISEKATVEQLENTTKQLHENMLSILNKSSKSASNEIYKTISNEVYKLEKLISEIPQFDPSQIETKFSTVIDYLEEKINSIVIPTIPEELSGETLVNKINVLPIEPSKQIDIEHIKGLEAELKAIRESKSAPSVGISNLRIQQAFKYILKTEAMQGTVDGANTAFTVSQPIFAVLSLSINGEIIAQLPNYTISGRTITFSTALPLAYAGKDFECKYI